MNIMHSKVVEFITRSCLRRTFWAHHVIKMMWCDTCDFLRQLPVMLLFVVHSVNHSNVHLIISFTVQSDTSNFARYCKHILWVKWAIHVEFWW